MGIEGESTSTDLKDKVTGSSDGLIHKEKLFTLENPEEINDEIGRLWKNGKKKTVENFFMSYDVFNSFSKMNEEDRNDVMKKALY